MRCLTRAPLIDPLISHGSALGVCSRPIVEWKLFLDDFYLWNGRLIDSPTPMEELFPL